MNKWLLLVFLSVPGSNVMAQTAAQTTGESANEARREQRRVELRSVLQANRNDKSQAVDNQAPAGRHLTSQQRAEMRQQLREHQSERPARP